MNIDMIMLTRFLNGETINGVRLTKHQVKILKMRFYDDLKYTEIDKRLTLKPGNAESIKRRAIKKISPLFD